MLRSEESAAPTCVCALGGDVLNSLSPGSAALTVAPAAGSWCSTTADASQVSASAPTESRGRPLPAYIVFGRFLS